MKNGHRQIALILSVVALGGAAGCGSSNGDEGPGVPQDIAAEIDKELDSLNDRVGVEIPGACGDAQDENIPAIQRQVSALPADTDPEVRSALADSIDNLSTLLDDRCQEIADKAERERQETDTVETAPPQTETETTPETNTETAPTTTPETPNGNGNGNNGNGNGNNDDDDEGGGSTPPGGDGSGGVLSP